MQEIYLSVLDLKTLPSLSLPSYRRASWLTYANCAVDLRYNPRQNEPYHTAFYPVSLCCGVLKCFDNVWIIIEHSLQDDVSHQY